jgi:two-component system sensor kinase FixL
MAAIAKGIARGKAGQNNAPDHRSRLSTLEKNIRHSLARGYWFALGAAAVLMLFAAWAIGRSVETAANSALTIESHYQAMAAADELMSLAQDVETGQRGYVITGSSQYLQPYEAALPRLGDVVAKLRRATKGQATSARHIERIEALLEDKIKLSKASVALRRQGTSSPSTILALAGRGKDKMDALRSSVRALRLNEARLLDEGRDKARQAERNALIQALLAGIVTLIAGGLAVLGLVRMLAQLRRKSSEVADADRRFQATFDQAAVGMAHLDPTGRWLKVNDELCRITGFRADELNGTHREITHPDDIAPDKEQRARLIAGEIDGYKRAKRYIRKDGRPAWVNVTVSAIRGSDGKPEYLVAVIEDIEDRKRTERELQSGEAQYKAIFDSAVEAIAVIDEEGIVQSINPATLTMFGYNQKQLIGSNISMLMPKAIAKKHDHYLARYRETGKRAIIGFGREVEGRRSDGTIFPLDLSVAEWRSDGQRFFTGIMRDISARKLAEDGLRLSEEQLRRLQNEFAHLSRVNDLGEMAAAIAHEINQPLTAISNFLNAGRLNSARDEIGSERADDFMRLAAEQAVRAGQIVRRLRDFVGKGDGSREVRPVGELLDAAMGIALVDARSRGIRIERNKEADDCRVEADSIQMQQVIVNLLRNAVDALEQMDGGHERKVEVATARMGKNVEIRVSDNAGGIAPDMMDHLFEPFMTSKPSGMGMGLSVCRRLVEAHGGTIGADPDSQEGATFRIELPIRQDEAPA